MNYLDVFLQTSKSGKVFPTNFASMMFSLMIILCMDCQFHLKAKGTTAYIANKSFLISMNYINMFLFGDIAREAFVTNFAIEVLL